MLDRTIHASGATAAVSSRGLVQQSARAWLVLACALSGSCSFLINTSEQQCASDADCLARGLTGSTCVANLCQAVRAAAGNGSTISGVGTAGTPSDASTPPEPPNDAEVMSEAGGGAPPTAGAGAAGSPSRAGSGGAGRGAAAGSAGIGGSMSSGECETAADCERRGLGAGSTCVDSKCFAPEPQCETDEDCLAKGPEYMGGRCADKQCLPNPLWRCDPPAPASPTKMVRIKLPVIDALQLGPLANVPVVACSKLDYECMRPIAMGASDMAGDAFLEVPENFSGYLQQNERRDFAPGLYFVPPRLPEDGALRNFPLIPSALTAGLAIPLGTSLNSMRGHIMVIAEDCMGTAVPGATYTSPQADMGTTVFYTRDQVPNAMAKETSRDGTGGFVNLPSGNVEITLKQLETDMHLATVTVIIRPGYISAVYIRPMSRGSVVTGVFPTGGM